MYMGGLYNYCIVICFAVLTTFHSVPIFPRRESWAFNGDNTGVQGLSSRTCARNLPSAGFATLSAFHRRSVLGRFYCNNNSLTKN